MSESLVTGTPRLTATRARELLDYSPETGALTWKVRRRKVKVGKEAGCVERRGRAYYRTVRVDGTKYYAGSLCFLVHYGAWPSGEIDHINGNGLDNRIANLRAVTGAVNRRNQSRQMNNTSGVTGVDWHRPTAKWRARITTTSGRETYLGLFGTLAQAVSVRKRAEQLYGYHPNHGRVPEEMTNVETIR